MNPPVATRPSWAPVAALLAVAFGAVTILVGATALFGASAQSASFGNIVPFVLWFNFAAGFAYIAAGYGILRWKRWAAPLTTTIAATTVIVFVALGIHIFLGGTFEARTIGAMSLRSLVWIAMAITVNRVFRRTFRRPST